MAELWAIGLALLTTLIGAGSPILFKKATTHFQKGQFKSIKGIIKAFTHKYIILGICLSGTATLLFIPALKGGELSVLYPLISTQYIWVSLLSMKYLSEKITSLRWIGIALIITGIVAINLG